MLSVVVRHVYLSFVQCIVTGTYCSYGVVCCYGMRTYGSYDGLCVVITDTNPVFEPWILAVEIVIDHCTIVGSGPSPRKTLAEYVDLCAIHSFLKTIDKMNVIHVELKPQHPLLHQLSEDKLHVGGGLGPV